MSYCNNDHKNSKFHEAKYNTKHLTKRHRMKHTIVFIFVMLK